MTEKIGVRPARPGMKLVHMPSHTALPDEGAHWPNDQFTARRLRDGDIVKAEVPKDD